MRVKLTEWFGYDENPVHVGVYGTRYETLSGDWKSGYSWWNGFRFGVQRDTVAQACKVDCRHYGLHQKEWRGLAKEPKK